MRSPLGFMTKGENSMTRRNLRTITARINPDDWHPISEWLHRHRAGQAPLGMHINGEAQPGLGQMIRKTRRAGPLKDITIRLPSREMERLHQQILFWSCCIDELRPEFRQDAPRWEYFHCMAYDIEYAIQQFHWENQRRNQTAPRRPVHRITPSPA